MNNGLIEYGIKALIIKDKQFLAVHKRGIKSNKFELPGGRLMFGETAEEAVVREVLEETGLHVLPVSLVDTWNWVSDARQVTGVIYLCTIKAGNDVVLSDEHDEYMWLPFTEESMEKMNKLFAPKLRKWSGIC